VEEVVGVGRNVMEIHFVKSGGNTLREIGLAKYYSNTLREKRWK
jgi:hypothetical protein